MSTKLRNVRRNDLIHPELSYQILGALFSVFTELGYGHKENIYQRALAKELKNAQIKFYEQSPVKIRYKSEFVGIYYLDFLIEDKVILELKVRNFFSKKDISQIYSYLKGLNLKLGILAHFTQNGVKYKRVLNIK